MNSKFEYCVVESQDVICQRLKSHSASLCNQIFFNDGETADQVIIELLF